MKSMNLKNVIATSLVTGTIALAATASANDNVTPKSMEVAMSGKSTDKKCAADGKCGAGKCGDKKKTEKTSEAKQKGSEGSCGEGSCG